MQTNLTRAIQIFIGIVLLASCKKEQETVDALKVVWEINELRFNYSSNLNLLNFHNTIQFSPC